MPGWQPTTVVVMIMYRKGHESQHHQKSPPAKNPPTHTARCALVQCQQLSSLSGPKALHLRQIPIVPGSGGRGCHRCCPVAAPAGRAGRAARSRTPCLQRTAMREAGRCLPGQGAQGRRPVGAPCHPLGPPSPTPQSPECQFTAASRSRALPSATCSAPPCQTRTVGCLLSARSVPESSDSSRRPPLARTRTAYS